MKKLSLFVSVIYVIAAVLFTVTFSIGLPIYVRGFYFAQIDTLELEELSGADRSEIKEAYNALMDYLVYPNAEFSTGVFKYSEEGKSHFEDCKSLFSLNASVLIASTVILLVTTALDKTKRLPLARRDLLAVAGGATLSTCTLFVLAIALDFERAFDIFHRLFFIGKDNWAFNPVTDEIINVLPVGFFANCAALIGAGIIAISLIFIVVGTVKKRKFHKVKF